MRAMVRSLFAAALLGGCGSVVSPAATDARADAPTPPHASDGARDAAYADGTDVGVRDAFDSVTDAALSCVPVGAPAPTAIVTAEDLAFPEPVVTLEDFLRWYERFHYLDLLRCPHDYPRGWASTLYADVAPFDRSRWRITQRWRFLVTTGVVQFDPDAALECLRDLRARPACGYLPMHVYPSCRRAIAGGVPQGARCGDDVQCAPGLRCGGAGTGPYATCNPIPPLRPLAPGSTDPCDPALYYIATGSHDALEDLPLAGMTRCASGEACGWDPVDRPVTAHCHRPIGIGCTGPAYGTFCPPGYHAEALPPPHGGIVQCNPIGALPPFGNVGAPCDTPVNAIDPAVTFPDPYANSGHLRCTDGLRCAFTSRAAMLPTCLPRAADYSCHTGDLGSPVYADGPGTGCDYHTHHFEPEGPGGAPCLDHGCVSEYCAYVTSDQASPENRCASHIAPDGGVVY